MSTYIERANAKLQTLFGRDDFLLAAIESSCDETAVAVLRGGEVLSNVISSQIEIHKRFGGVVPEIASRAHAEAIDNVFAEALKEASVNASELDAVAVTYGAGLLGALLVGVSYAKALAYSLDIPLIAVNHVEGHIAANFITEKELRPPYISLLASGGHTEITLVTDSGVKVLGSTVDDAVGEAFDKAARVLGLPYPGGPEIEKLAKEGNANIEFCKSYKNSDNLNFSYSGLKTAVINYVRNREARGEAVNRADVAASFQAAAVGMLADAVLRAVRSTGVKTVSVGGGVAANGYLRKTLQDMAERESFKLYLPEKRLCTDNAAMIGVKAFLDIKRARAHACDLSLDANPNL